MTTFNLMCSLLECGPYVYIRSKPSFGDFEIYQIERATQKCFPPRSVPKGPLVGQEMEEEKKVERETKMILAEVFSREGRESVE